MLVVVGRIGRAHGIRGEVNVDPRTDEPERRFAPGSSVVAAGQRLTVVSARSHGARLVVRFEQVPDRTVAETLHGQVVEAEIDPEAMPDDPDEFYDHQLVGLAAVDASGTALGAVAEVVHAPGQDLLVIRAGERELLVPFVEALVPEVDLAAGRLVVADVPGLVDPDLAEEVR